MDKEQNILEVKDLITVFDDGNHRTLAVNEITFGLKKGSVLGIVGESGSGKSVTSLSVMRLISNPGQIYGGSILFNDHGKVVDLALLKESQMQKYRGGRIAMIFQEPMSSLNPSHRCGAQVEEMLKLHTSLSREERKKKVIALFERVRLPDPERIFKSYPHQLSGGQLQRVMIAMAVSCNPQIIIADEPTTALDVTVQKEILKLLREIKSEFNASIIFINHDLGVIKEIAQDVVVMHRGKIVESGSIDTVFNDPKHPYTKGLIACRPPLNHRMSRLPIVQDFLDRTNEEHHTFLNNLIEPISVFEKRIQGLQQADTILEVKDLHKWFPSKKSFFGHPLAYTKAVNGVSFSLKKGETLGLVGESGCGKSTLGNTILRLVPATSGSAHFEGQNIFELAPRALRKMRKDIQIIFQDPYSSLNPRMKIGKAIVEPMQVHKIHGNHKQRKDKAIELLETVGMSADHFDRYPHEFSGGQRQRICIARTLSMEPRFIVCDESVSALDVSVQAQVLNLLNELKQKFELSYIFISHDLSVIKHISDNIIVMKDGQIVEYGNAEQIYHHPTENYTKELINAIPGR